MADSLVCFYRSVTLWHNTGKPRRYTQLRRADTELQVTKAEELSNQSTTERIHHSDE